jgi:APA family basic amino acid/polyamine antiporter
MKGLPAIAWTRFIWWLVIGLVLYFLYGFRHSTLRLGTGPVTSESD